MLVTSYSKPRSFRVGEAGDSIIENTLDVGVVYPRHTPRVEIQSVRMLRVQNDEGAVYVSAQNNSNPRINLRTCKRMMEIYESMLWRLANDLCRKVRKENDFLLLIRHQEILDLLRHNHPVPRVAQVALKHVVGVHYRDARGILSDDLMRHAERN